MKHKLITLLLAVCLIGIVTAQVVVPMLKNVEIEPRVSNNQEVTVTIDCGKIKNLELVLDEPNGDIDKNDIRFVLKGQCTETIKNIRMGNKIMKQNQIGIVWISSSYYCEDRDIYYDCDDFSKYYGLEQGKCISSKGNKLCRTGWILI